MCPLGIAWGAVATRRAFVREPAYLVPARDSGGSANVLRAALAAGGQLLHDRSFDLEVQIVSRTSATGGTLAYRVVNAAQAIGPPIPFDFATGEGTSLDLAVEVSAWRAGALQSTGVYVWLDATRTDSSLPAWDGLVPGDRYFVNVSDGGVWGSAPWDGRDLSTLHHMIECSGRGACDRASGACWCDAGFAGIACQRLACPGSCSGHGLCQSQHQFALAAAQEAGLDRVPSGLTWAEDLEASGVLRPSYALAYDAEKAAGCLCDPGFKGPRCNERECPSYTDPLGGPGGSEGRDCSGRGRCNTGTGECECFPGFAGSACEQLSSYV
jgi:hypothetical protein